MDGNREIFIHKIVGKNISAIATKFIKLFVERHVMLIAGNKCVRSERGEPIFGISVRFVVVVECPESGIRTDEKVLQVSDRFVFWYFLER